MMSQPAAASSRYDTYAGNPAENYERYFVSSIGAPSTGLVLTAADLRQGERVLDVGCGTGVATRLAAEAVGPSGRVTGVDINPAMLAVARSAAPAQASISWHQASAEDLPLEDRSVDAVLCSLAFQFFTDKAQALREMRRVLTPGGRAVLHTPGPTPPLFEVIEAALDEHIGREASAFVAAVFSVHDAAELRAQLDDAGFSETRVETGTVAVRLPASADFFWQYMTSTPLAPLAARLDATARAALERDVVQRTQPFSDGDGLAMDVRGLVATARRSS